MGFVREMYYYYYYYYYYAKKTRAKYKVIIILWTPLAKYVITISVKPLPGQQNTWKACRGFL